MEKTVEHLEALFQKADSDVNKLSQRLKNEFEKNEDLASNPMRLVQNISDIKKDYSSIVEQAADIQQAQKEVVGQFQSQLSDVCQLLIKLQENKGGQMGEKPEELTRLEEFLGAPVPWGDVGGARHTLGTDGEVGQQPEDSHRDIDDTECSACSSEDMAMSPLSRRQSSDDFQELSATEFNSVSELIRGRAKLSEVNSHFCNFNRNVQYWTEGHRCYRSS